MKLIIPTYLREGSFSNWDYPHYNVEALSEDQVNQVYNSIDELVLTPDGKKSLQTKVNALGHLQNKFRNRLREMLDRIVRDEIVGAKKPLHRHVPWSKLNPPEETFIKWQDIINGQK